MFPRQEKVQTSGTAHRRRAVPAAGFAPRQCDPDAAAAWSAFPDGIVAADGEARLTYLNPAAERLLGVTLEQVHGRRLESVLRLCDRATGEALAVAGLTEPGLPVDGAFPCIARRDGTQVPVLLRVVRPQATSGAMPGYLVSLRDAGGIQQVMDEMGERSMRDEHSGLLRRAELVKRMWRLLQGAESGEPQAFIFLDIDDFKALNDKAGHAAGDLAIRQVAGRLKAVVRERDTLARLGGDEFGLLLEGCPGDRAREVAEQLTRAVDGYVLRWNGETYRVGISVGVACFGSRKHSLNTILAAADSACCEAKRSAGAHPHIREVKLD